MLRTNPIVKQSVEDLLARSKKRHGLNTILRTYFFTKFWDTQTALLPIFTTLETKDILDIYRYFFIAYTDTRILPTVTIDPNLQMVTLRHPVIYPLMRLRSLNVTKYVNASKTQFTKWQIYMRMWDWLETNRKKDFARFCKKQSVTFAF